MPFVNLKMYKGRTQEQKKEIARRITDVIHEVTQVPREYIWVVIEDIEKKDWAIGGKLGDEG